MPTYEYLREDGEVITIKHSINDDPLNTCPTTGLAVKRKVSYNSNVIFRGDGWDFKRQAADKRKLRAKQDPLYTTLPEYKGKIDEFKDKHKIPDTTNRKIMSYGK